MNAASEVVSCRQVWDDRVELRAPGGAESVYRHGGLPKPCVHPLTTASGQQLSGFEMSDHVWHRGLWFTIKFVNGTNFWEENDSFGVQRSARQPLCEAVGPQALRLTHELTWTSEATGPVIEEKRTLLMQTDPNAQIIDWVTELRAVQDLSLDRTPYTTWGGYGGLAFRSSRELHDAKFMLPGGETTASLAGQPHDWCLMFGSVDGGPGRTASIGMIDHPANPRSPSPWYCKAGGGFNYINPAFLFHEPMQLPRGKALKLAYRVAWRDGVWTAQEFAELARSFRERPVDSLGEVRR